MTGVGWLGKRMPCTVGWHDQRGGGVREGMEVLESVCGFVDNHVMKSTGLFNLKVFCPGVFFFYEGEVIASYSVSSDCLHHGGMIWCVS